MYIYFDVWAEFSSEDSVKKLLGWFFMQNMIGQKS